jgi:hypothetical protein
MTSAYVDSVPRTWSQQNVQSVHCISHHLQQVPYTPSLYAYVILHGRTVTLCLPNYMVLYYSKGLLNLYSNKWLNFMEGIRPPMPLHKHSNTKNDTHPLHCHVLTLWYQQSKIVHFRLTRLLGSAENTMWNSDVFNFQELRKLTLFKEQTAL